MGLGIGQPTSGAGQPHLQAGQPMGSTWQPLVAMSVLHRLKNCIYVVLLSRFDPRVQDASRPVYIPAYTPSSRGGI